MGDQNPVGNQSGSPGLSGRQGVRMQPRSLMNGQLFTVPNYKGPAQLQGAGMETVPILKILSYTFFIASLLLSSGGLT